MAHGHKIVETKVLTCIQIYKLDGISSELFTNIITTNQMSVDSVFIVLRNERRKKTTRDRMPSG